MLYEFGVFGVDVDLMLSLNSLTCILFEDIFVGRMTCKLLCTYSPLPITWGIGEKLCFNNLIRLQ